jgi:hypothetical protein
MDAIRIRAPKAAEKATRIKKPSVLKVFSFKKLGLR